MNILLDYGLGNVRSLETALAAQGMKVKVTNCIDEIRKAEAIFLPGVGAYRDASRALWESGLADVLIKRSEEGAYLIGICLGMQLLYEKSNENGCYRGLGLIPGEIVKLKQMRKVPHMGWNNLEMEKEDSLIKYITPSDFVYFVHSYYAKSEGEEIIASTDYGEKVPAIVRKGRTIGFQFHPEKSGYVGEALLKALAEEIRQETAADKLTKNG